jgi:hypothetical protein
MLFRLSVAATRGTARMPCQTEAESHQRIALDQGESVDGFAGLMSRSRPRGLIERSGVNCHE